MLLELVDAVLSLDGSVCVQFYVLVPSHVVSLTLVEDVSGVFCILF